MLWLEICDQSPRSVVSCTKWWDWMENFKSSFTEFQDILTSSQFCSNLTRLINSNAFSWRLLLLGYGLKLNSCSQSAIKSQRSQDELKDISPDSPRSKWSDSTIQTVLSSGILRQTQLRSNELWKHFRAGFTDENLLSLINCVAPRVPQWTRERLNAGRWWKLKWNSSKRAACICES